MAAPWQHLQPSKFQFISPLPVHVIEAEMKSRLSDRNGRPMFGLTPFEAERHYTGEVTAEGFRLLLPDLFFTPMAEAVGTWETTGMGTRITLTISPKWPIHSLVPGGMALTFLAFLTIFVLRPGSPQAVASVLSMMIFLVTVLRPLLLIQTEKLRILKGLEKVFSPQQEGQ